MDVVFIHVTFGFFTGARKRFNVIYCFCFLFTTLNKSLGEGGVGGGECVFNRSRVFNLPLD